MRDKYNLNTLPPGVMPEDAELLDSDSRANANIPGMGPDDKVGADGAADGAQDQNSSELTVGIIPGLDVEPAPLDLKPVKKVPYAKPIPRNFQAQWNDGHPAGRKLPSAPTPTTLSGAAGSDDEDGLVLGVDPVAFGMEQLGRATLSLFGFPAREEEQIEMLETVQSMPAAELPTPTAVIVDSTILPIEAESELEKAVRAGEDNLHGMLTSMGLNVVRPSDEEEPTNAPSGERPPAEPYNRDRELNDDDQSYNYPRSRTPVLDDSFGGGYPRGHSGIVFL